ncbi:transposase [Paraburkholderia sp. WC7.3g]|uniref:IS110 family transposase n=1 Tax=Paraburkholderia podalyriae TaxID=1938811 RepID=A0ABR7PZE7_9BURK|nr:IS110 family transposase [Paraburkholderia podalyriae]
MERHLNQADTAVACGARVTSSCRKYRTGPVAATHLVAAVREVKRYRSPKDVARRFAQTPHEHSSGRKEKSPGIGKFIRR